MNDERERKPVRVTREELYRQVWETPMIRLGKTYGISGNGLAKICDRLKVPYPPLGYWSKLRAGKPVKPTELPEPDPQTPAEVTITPTPPPAPAAEPKIEPEMAARLEKASATTAAITGQMCYGDRIRPSRRG